MPTLAFQSQRQRALLLQKDTDTLFFDAKYLRMKSLPFLLFLGFSNLLSAQGDDPAIPPPEDSILPEKALFDFIKDGGVMMIPLALMALIGLILILLYMLTIRRGAVVTNRYMNNADSLLRKKDYMGLISYSHRRSEMVARLTTKTLQYLTDNPRASAAEVKEIAESEGSRQSSLMAQRINWLGDIGAIAPMLGLLGTVIGMVQSFTFISQGGSPGNLPMQLANGISQALVTTASGLVIGITAIIFHSYFKGRVNRLLHEFEAAATHLITILTNQMKEVPAPPQPPQAATPAPMPATEMYTAQDVVLPPNS